MAGIILFGTDVALRRLFLISSRIDYIPVEGREWVPHPEKRYWRGSCFGNPWCHCQYYERYLMQPNNIFCKDIPLKPDVIIREAICNAVMHRDYRAGQRIQIIRYTNRIEFLNPEYSLQPQDQLGLPGSITRNDHIAEVPHDLQLSK